ncbi:hypothetical protein AB1484_36810 [Parafrankia sp. FMc6]|uniref:hypothetical protein n=1 Tax=Parafrankia soli TaxID=2599596 RepID=UPI0034D510B7
MEIRVQGGEDEVLRAVAELGRMVTIEDASPIRRDGRHTHCIHLKARLRPVEDTASAAQRDRW